MHTWLGERRIQILNKFPRKGQNHWKPLVSRVLLQSCGSEHSQSIHLFLSNTHFWHPRPTVRCCQGWQTHGPLGLESHTTGPTHTTPCPSLPSCWGPDEVIVELVTQLLRDDPSLHCLCPASSHSLYFSTVFSSSPLLHWERQLANDTLALKSRSSWEQSDSRGGSLKELASHPSPLESGKGSRPESRSQWWLLSGFFSYLLHEGCDLRGVQRTSCSQSSSTSHINIKSFQNNAA